MVVVASIDTAKAVSCEPSLLATIIGIRSSSKRAPVQGMQMMPLPLVAMKLIASGVTFSAAITKSPSFSRSASSTTMMMRPSWISSRASSVDANP